MSVNHSSLKHIPFCRRPNQVSSYHITVIICFVIIQIRRGNGRTVELHGYITFRKRIVQQRRVLNYILLTYYLQVKNANLHKARSALKCLQFYTFLYISINFNLVGNSFIG